MLDGSFTLENLISVVQEYPTYFVAAGLALIWLLFPKVRRPVDHRLDPGSNDFDGDGGCGGD